MWITSQARLARFLALPSRRAELACRNPMLPVERVELVPAELGSQAGVTGEALWGPIGDADAV